MVLRNEFLAGRIGFDVDGFLSASPNNKLLVIHAGYSPGSVANSVPRNVCVAQEKIGSNSWFAAYAMLDNLDVAAHEVGHLIGFRTKLHIQASTFLETKKCYLLSNSSCG